MKTMTNACFRGSPKEINQINKQNDGSEMTQVKYMKRKYNIIFANIGAIASYRWCVDMNYEHFMNTAL